jgi:hypothetical protein
MAVLSIPADSITATRRARRLARLLELVRRLLGPRKRHVLLLGVMVGCGPPDRGERR